MFGFGKISKRELSNRIWKLAVDASEQFLGYLKEDAFLYGKCINQNPIKITTAIFMVNIYRDMLNSKYDSNDVFTVIRATVMTLAPNKAADDMFMGALIEYMKQCNQTVEYYSQFPNFNIADVLTKVYFSLIIDDRDYLQTEMDYSISRSVSYRKIYNHIDGVLKHRTLLNDKYNLRLK